MVGSAANPVPAPAPLPTTRTVDCPSIGSWDVKLKLIGAHVKDSSRWTRAEPDSMLESDSTRVSCWLPIFDPDADGDLDRHPAAGATP